MSLVRLLLRVLMLVVGAFIGLALFVIAVLGFVTFLIVSLLTGRKPNLRFSVNKNPWAARQPPAGDVVDVEAREVRDGTQRLPPPHQG